MRDTHTKKKAHYPSTGYDMNFMYNGRLNVAEEGSVDVHNPRVSRFRWNADSLGVLPSHGWRREHVAEDHRTRGPEDDVDCCRERPLDAL